MVHVPPAVHEIELVKKVVPPGSTLVTTTLVGAKLKVVLAGTPQSAWNSNISIHGKPSPKRFPS